MNIRITLRVLLATALLVAPATSHARWMSPNTGRFQTMDTYEGSSADPSSLHKYLYVGGNPVNNVDPSGNDFVSLVLDIVNILGSFDGLLNVGAAGVERLATGRDDNTTKVLWAETGSVYPGLKQGSTVNKFENWDSGSRRSLNKAREKIAKIVNAGKQKVAEPKPLPDVSGKNPIVWVKAQVDDVRAAREAAGNRTSNDKVFMWPSDDGGKTPTSSPRWAEARWPYDYKAYESYGAFRVLARKSGDPVPVSDKVYFFFYDNVP
jgi:hypothetical protein